MNERIKLIIDKEQLSPSKFADMIGVQRSSISHILSGRNNPSLDFVQKVLLVFENISSDWLLFARGEMYRTKPVTLFDTTKPIEKEQTTEKQIVENKIEPKIETTKQETIKPDPQITKQEIKQEEKVVKQPEQIVIFYSDKTFDIYSPK